jgi:hypothetical protein
VYEKEAAHLDVGVRVADGPAIVGGNVGDAALAELVAHHLQQLVGGLLLRDQSSIRQETLLAWLTADTGIFTRIKPSVDTGLEQLGSNVCMQGKYSLSTRHMHMHHRLFVLRRPPASFLFAQLF